MHDPSRPTSRPGPLSSLRVVEMAGMGPTPFAAMVLADLGADVVRIDRLNGAVNIARVNAQSGSVARGAEVDLRTELLNRGRRSIAVDLKTEHGADLVVELTRRADAFIEGYRPGVAERLGIGPDVLLRHNPQLIYARLSGYGQTGPLADDVGHDLNFLAHTGVLSMVGRRGAPPTVLPALVGDFGGGGMALALGVVAGVLEARLSGVGQVVDASIAEGAALLATAFYGFVQSGDWSAERGTNIGDGGAPFYDVYETADGGWVAIAAVESQFYREALDVLGLSEDELPEQYDVANWPVLREAICDAIKKRPRSHWREVSRHRPACVTVMLTPSEALADDDSRARGTFIERDGVAQPAPTPRFSRTPPELDKPPPTPGEHSEEILADWDVAPDQRRRWHRAGAYR